MPIGLKGLMVASFFAAFMGTMESHYNLTASYAINDVYARFLARNKTAQHYVRASRVATIFVAIAAGITALLLGSVLGAFRFKMELVAGVGLVYVLRWLWWRVNALTEIAALVVSIVAAIALNLVDATSGGGAAGSAARLVAVVALSSLVAVVTALATKPEAHEHLAQFYAKVRPPRLLWQPIADDVDTTRALRGEPTLASDYGANTFARIAIAIAFVFCTMIGIGKLILGDPVLGTVLVVVGVACGVVTIRRVLRE
jgi:Na+/proline symporter